MMVIPETCRVHSIRYLRFYFIVIFNEYLELPVIPKRMIKHMFLKM